MRFIHAWAAIASQNISLKVAVAALSFGVLALSFVSTKLALKQPLVFERACYTRALNPSPTVRHSATEVEAFVKEALGQRFNSDVTVIPGFISQDEERFKFQEQQELKKREMSQKIVVNAVKLDGSTAFVDTDRVISVGKIRSALAFPLTLTLTSGTRTDSNPYGLVVTKISAPSQLAEEKSK